MRRLRIWLPDGESCKVEWYLSGGKAVGVTSITDEFLPEEVGESRGVGFTRPRANSDPPRDAPYDPERDPFEARH